MPSNPLELSLPPLKSLDIDCTSSSSHIKAVTIFIQDKIFIFSGNGKDVKMKTPDGKTKITLPGSNTAQSVTVVILHASTGHGDSADHAIGFFKLSTLAKASFDHPFHSNTNVTATDPATNTEECLLMFMF